MIVAIFLLVLTSASPNHGGDVKRISGASVTVVVPEDLAATIGGEHKCTLTSNDTGLAGLLFGRYVGGTHWDDCEEIVCGVNAECENGTCVCRFGYQGDPEFHCDWLGHCFGVRCGANQFCNITNGDCECDEGYKYSRRTRKCEEWDECRDVYCVINAECQKGMCVCENGYTGDPELYCQEIVDFDPIDVEFCIMQKFNPKDADSLEVAFHQFCADLLTPWESNCEAATSSVHIYPQYMNDCAAENHIWGKCTALGIESCDEDDVKTRVRIRIKYNRKQVAQNTKYEFFEERFDKLRGLRDPLVGNHYWFPEKHPTRPIGIVLDTIRIGTERTELPSTAEVNCKDQLRVGCSTVIKDVLNCSSAVAAKYCAETCGHCSTKNRHDRLKDILYWSHFGEFYDGTLLQNGDMDWCPGIPDQMCAHMTVIDKCPNKCQQARCFPANVTCTGASGQHGICDESPSDGFTLQDGECDIGCTCWTRPTCVDVFSTEDCERLREIGYCTTHADQVHNYCLKTCLNCQGVTTCKDHNENMCKELGERKLCHARYTILMGWNKICPKTCKICSNISSKEADVNKEAGWHYSNVQKHKQ